MKISTQLALIVSTTLLLSAGALAADQKTEKKTEDRKPASSCTISSNRAGVVISGDCASDLREELSNKGMRSGTVKCESAAMCTVTSDNAAGGGDSGAGGR